MRPALILALGLALAAVDVSRAAAPPDGNPRPEVLTASFLAAHPDIKFRMAGIEAMHDQLHEAAFEAFRDASLYADKASQAMVAELYWSGTGVAQDRALAYAWMDLAAERGYTHFIALREKYWKQLDAAERERAVQEGQAIYAEYGDSAAKPRLKRKLDAGRRQITGSRVGFVGALKVMVAGPTGEWLTLDGSTYYADHYWRADDYFEWQDRVWSAPPQGTVDVGPISSAATRPQEAAPTKQE